MISHQKTSDNGKHKRNTKKTGLLQSSFAEALHIPVHTYLHFEASGKPGAFLLVKLDLISDYLFRSSYMPVKPYGMGFSGIFRIGRYSHSRLKVFRFSR